MYVNKISSGTILALLALSGVLFLVPLAVPAHASQNASLPTITLSNNLVTQNLGTGESITIANPATNAYAIDAITVTAPAGWNFSTAAAAGVACGASFTTLTPSLTAFSCSGASILPGFSATIVITGNGVHGAGGTGIQGPAVKATANPASGIFSTSLIDGGSSPAAYVGPSFTLWSIAAPVSVNAGSSATSFVAGSAPATLTATLGSGEPGVPVTWTVVAGTTAAGTFSGCATTGPCTSNTVSGAATITYTPSNLAGTATVTATVQDPQAGSPASNVVETTVANAPSTISFTFTVGGKVLPSTHWIEGSSLLVGSAEDANVPASTFSYAISDSYTNPASSLSGTSGKFSATNGFFDGVATTVTTAAYGAAAGAITDSYQQSGVFGTIGLISGTFTGTYTPASGPCNTGCAFSVSGSSGNLETSLIGTGVTSFTLTTNGITAITNPVKAGTFIVPDLVLNIAQAGVPVTINLCGHAEVGCAGTTKAYTGTFASNNLQSITVNTVNVAGAAQVGNASAHFNVDTSLAHAAFFNATVLAPIDGTPKNTIAAGPIGPATTGAGSAALFEVAVTLVSGASPGPTVTNVVAGGTAYVDVFTADKFGNVVTTALVQQTQINIAATSGSLSVTSAYIPVGCWETNGTSGVGCTAPQTGFGDISFTVSAIVGTVSTLTVSGVLGGIPTSTSVAVTSVSKLPTLSVTSPTPRTVAGVSLIPSQSPAVVFQGKAAASIGYPSSVTISSVAYKIGAGFWQTATVTPANAITWSLAATLPQGLSTIQFNATDSKSNVVVSSTYTVLVDNNPPTFTIGTPVAGAGSDTVTITTTQGDFNTTTFAATYGVTSIASSAISWSGTQTLGSPSTLTATINGLTAGTAVLQVSGSTYTGVAATNSASITISIAFANSITFTTSSASYGLVGAYKGISLSVTNNWNTQQIIVVYATFKSGTSLYIAQGTTTLAAGQTATVFCIDLQAIPAGSYSVTFSAVTTSNLAVSAPTTAITVVTT